MVINKIDRADARPMEVLNAVFDLFSSNWTPTRRRSISRDLRRGPARRVDDRSRHPRRRLPPLFDAILKHVPPPDVRPEAPLQMLVVTLDWSDLRGPHRHRPGRRGQDPQEPADRTITHTGERINTQVKQLYTFDRLGRIETDEVGAERHLRSSSAWKGWTSAPRLRTLTTPSPCRRSRSTSRRST
ncbi:MAG: hypothetical protein U0793_33120 [Gemmataceae bacterium]